MHCWISTTCRHLITVTTVFIINAEQENTEIVEKLRIKCCRIKFAEHFPFKICSLQASPMFANFSAKIIKNFQVSELSPVRVDLSTSWTFSASKSSDKLSLKFGISSSICFCFSQVLHPITAMLQSKQLKRSTQEWINEFINSKFDFIIVSIIRSSNEESKFKTRLNRILECWFD